MAVNYRAVAKKNPSNQTAPAKYYPQVKSTGDTTLRQLAKEISEISTVSTTDAMAVIEGFLAVVPRALANGKIVRLGEFGSFSISVNGEGSTTADELSRHHIKKASVKFRPGKIFQQEIVTIEFKKIS